GGRLHRADHVGHLQAERPAAALPRDVARVGGVWLAGQHAIRGRAAPYHRLVSRRARRRALLGRAAGTISGAGYLKISKMQPRASWCLAFAQPATPSHGITRVLKEAPPLCRPAHVDEVAQQHGAAMERIAARLAEGDARKRPRAIEAPYRAAIKHERHRRVVEAQAPLVRCAVAGQARERDARAAAGALGILEELEVVRRGLDQ